MVWRGRPAAAEREHRPGALRGRVRPAARVHAGHSRSRCSSRRGRASDTRTASARGSDGRSKPSSALSRSSSPSAAGGRFVIVPAIIGAGRRGAVRLAAGGTAGRCSCCRSRSSLFSSAVFLAREEPAPLRRARPDGPLQRHRGSKNSPLESAYRSFSINLGEQLRVDRRAARRRHPQPRPSRRRSGSRTTLTDRAVDPTDDHRSERGGLADLHVRGAVAARLRPDIGAAVRLRSSAPAAHMLYPALRARVFGDDHLGLRLPGGVRSPTRSTSTCSCSSVYPILDLIALFVLSRMLVERAEPAVADPAWAAA